jgi:hypothetical protein
MKKTLAVAGIGVALLGAGTAHADDHHGSKGDRDVRAFWEDTNRMVANPRDFPGGVCQARRAGVSEAELMSPPWSGALSASFVASAEYHFCPEYLS